MWKVAQAAVQGRGHISADIPCQDKTFFVRKNDACAISLADGAGSAMFSHFGAEKVVECVSNLLIDRFDEFYRESDPSAVRREVLSCILNDLETLKETLGCELSDLASTLLCAVVHDRRYIIFHLGDGVIGYQDDEALKVASVPDNGEFCNTTVFTTSENAEASIKLLKGEMSDSIKGFVLFSDGVESILYKHNKKEISQSLSPVFDDLAQQDSSEVEQNLLETLEEIKTHTQDDCSIIVMSKVPDSETSDEDASLPEKHFRKYVPAIIVGAVLLIVLMSSAFFLYYNGYGRQ